MAITKLYVDNTDQLISDEITEVKPVQEQTQVVNRLLDGSWHVQTIGQPRHSYELEFVVTGDKREQIDGIASAKNLVRLERHGEIYTGIIRDEGPGWDQVIGSTDPAKTKLICRVVMIVTGG